MENFEQIALDTDIKNQSCVLLLPAQGSVKQQQN